MKRNYVQNYLLSGFLLLGPLMLIGLAHADGSSIDKIYHPYVQPLERELEYRMIYSNEDDAQKHQIGYGQSLSDRWFAEGYIIAEKLPDQSLAIEAFELEAKWQLTEQGEFDNDWAVKFELERDTNKNGWEAVSTLIALHEWREWIGTVNASLIAEWGGGFKDEVETALAAQLKYRHSRELEPGVEFFMAQDTQAIGPVIMGSYRLGGRRGLFWECGMLAGLNAKTADLTLKMNLEYEF